MRLLRLATALGFTLAPLACLVPTDRSAELEVVIEETPELVIVGDTIRLRAALRATHGSTVPGAGLRYISSDAAVVEVLPDGKLVAHAPGSVTISIDAPAFAGAAAAERALEVRPRVTIDHVQPLGAFYGDTITIFGTGLDPAFIVRVLVAGQEAPIHSFRPDDPDEPQRRGRLVVRVPTGVGARAGITLQSLVQAAASPESISVVPTDRYEPNDTVPRTLTLGDGQWEHPLLALEARPGGFPPTADWYRVRTTTGELSVEVISRARYNLVVSDTLERQEFLFVSRGWTVGGEFKAVCRGRTVSGFGEGFSDFHFQQQQSETTLVALRGLPVGETLDLFISYDRAGIDGTYSLRVTDGYRSDAAADRFEGNEHCDQATPVTLGMANTGLTLDRPSDIDWYSVELSSPGQLTVSVTQDFIGLFSCPVVWILEDLRTPSGSQPVRRAASSQSASRLLLAPSALAAVGPSVFPESFENSATLIDWGICTDILNPVPFSRSVNVNAGRYFVVFTELTGRVTGYDFLVSHTP